MNNYFIAFFLMLSLVLVPANISAADINLPSVEITELLPNPKRPQTDAHDEFIELFNPSNKALDLRGYILQVGTTIKYRYTFPKGTQLRPNNYTAFYSNKTHLFLDDYSDQAILLSPQNKIINQSPIYRNANIGESWSKGLKNWFWSVKPTPGAPNIDNHLP